MEKELRLDVTKKGLPAIWESGGGSTNTGSAQIVAGPNGEKLTPIYVRRAGSLSNSEHALFRAEEGMMVIGASHHRRDFTIRVWRVTRLEFEKGRPIKVLPVESGLLAPGMSESQVFDLAPKYGSNRWDHYQLVLKGANGTHQAWWKNGCLDEQPNEPLFWLDEGEPNQWIAQLQTLAEFGQGEWSILAESPFCQGGALDGQEWSSICDGGGVSPEWVYAAVEKATCYHCREPHFVEV